MAQLHHSLRPWQITQRVTPEIGQPSIDRELVDNQRLGCSRQQSLAAVRQIAEPRSAVDRRAYVVAYVAQLRLPGVHPDPQPDRHQRRLLQLQRTRHRVTGPGERDNEAVAFTLLDPPPPAA